LRSEEAQKRSEEKIGFQDLFNRIAGFKAGLQDNF
jgi:hypothetical protein